MKILIIDNYDSFTYNLFHYVQQFNEDVQVVRNNLFDLGFVDNFDAIILSPGPGLPQNAGKTLEVICQYYMTKRILGICLGHQAIFQAFGGELKNLAQVLHGKSVETNIYPKKSYIFDGLPGKINTGRYHSFVADYNSLPTDIEIIADDIFGEIQAIKHKKYDVIGLQFHPESVLTEFGKTIIRNWVERV
ncbi:MAG: aminodeoxychorismate/anthranilate synthase component II [Bacteroidetes bacterium CG2_30_33_31]|nr:MAG: aminodeoxychorismate/anthranilate synthase component II [Bacteroidetes bacterium CG2_30_33_31]